MIELKLRRDTLSTPIRFIGRLSSDTRHDAEIT
jgi:hypothetical protein